MDIRPEDLRSLLDASRRVQRTSLIIASFCMVVAAIGAVAGWVLDRPGPAPWVVAGVGVMVAVAIAVIVRSAGKTASGIADLLLRDPAQVVWAYAGSTENRVNGVKTGVHGWIQLCLRDGRVLRLHVPKDMDEALLDIVARRARSARIGYSSEWAAQYGANPGAFGAENDQA